VFWGLLHGAALAVHKLAQRGDLVVRGERAAGWRSVSATILGWMMTYAFVCFAWVFFRAPDFATASLVLRKIVGFSTGGATWMYLPFWILAAAVAMAHLVGAIAARRPAAVEGLELGGRVAVTRPHAQAGLYVVFARSGFTSAFVLTAWLVVLYLFVPLHTSPFIYFRF
jgi:hypothetical protein